MDAIGGYFELELLKNNGFFRGENYFFLNSGRHALEFILRGIFDIQKVYLPYYTCYVVLQPLKELNIPYEFYSINSNLEIKENRIQNLKKNEYIILNNYFGLKDAYIDDLLEKFPNQRQQFIIDASQSLFYFNSLASYIFYSPRKFVGIPDGGIAYVGSNLVLYQRLNEKLTQNVSYHKCNHLLKRIDSGASAGYSDFKNAEQLIDKEKLSQMSSLAQRILFSLDFNHIKLKRQENFIVLHNSLAEINELDFTSFKNWSGALIYPFFTENASFLREKLIENKVFNPVFWSNVLDETSDESVDYKLASCIVFLPLDQRYSARHMRKIVEIVQNFNS